MDKEKVMPHTEFDRMSFDGLKLYFQLWQTDQSSKGIVSLVHGLGEHSGRYSHWAALLNDAGYDLITYDLRGHGKSEGLRGHINSFEEYLADTDILLEEAKGKFSGKPIFLYGHSLGAVIVCNYVLRRKPQLAGVIVTGLPNKSPLLEQKGKILLANVVGAALPKITMASGLDANMISRDQEVVKIYKNDPMVHNRTTAGFGKSYINAITWADQHVNEWTLPVLFLHGEKDQLGPVEGPLEFSSKISGDCTIKIWPGLFHEVHNEPEKKEVFTYLLNWLDAHSQPM
jgi:alpha-beta hydrolase superfamily lysophospholipase